MISDTTVTKHIYATPDKLRIVDNPVYESSGEVANSIVAAPAANDPSAPASANGSSAPAAGVSLVDADSSVEEKPKGTPHVTSSDPVTDYEITDDANKQANEYAIASSEAGPDTTPADYANTDSADVASRDNPAPPEPATAGTNDKTHNDPAMGDDAFDSYVELKEVPNRHANNTTD